MKAFFGLVLLVAAALAEVEVAENEIPLEMQHTALYYHDRVGVPEAARIQEAETKALESRIVGGTASGQGQFPHQAGLIIGLNDGRTSVCGASLVSNTRLITAAHCQWAGGNVQAAGMTVVLGSTTLFTGGTRVSSQSVTMHGSWNPNAASNDIAIINIPWVNYNNNIRNIALPTNAVNQLFVGNWATASGFGTVGSNIPIPMNQFLRHVNLQVISRVVCNLSYFVTILDSHLCTSGAGGIGTCGGDSGGPLVINFNGQPILIGATSFGSAAGCDVGSPSVFARVTSYLAWIQARL